MIPLRATGKYILVHSPFLFSDDEEGIMIRSSNAPVVGGISIYYYAGIINKSEINQMRKLLFRATKGKVLCKVCDDSFIEYDDRNKKLERCVYVLVFQDVNVLRQRTQKVCETLSPEGRRFSLPKNG